MNNKHINDEQKEFFSNLQEKVQDNVQSIEMVCIEANKYVFELLGLKPQKANTALWGLLVFSEKSLYFFANETEQTILGFRIGGASSKQKEQLFPFSNFQTWKAQRSVKKVLFFTCVEKFALQIEFSVEHSGEIKRGVFKLETQHTAKDVLSMLSPYS